MKKTIHKHKTIIAMLIAAALILAFSSCNTPEKLTAARYSKADLVKKGYSVPDYAPDSIYIQPTRNRSKVKVNIRRKLFFIKKAKA